MLRAGRQGADRTPCHRGLSTLAILAAAALAAFPHPADASDQALLRLLQVLRDRGSISAAEYEEIRLAAAADDEPDPTPSTAVESPALTELTTRVDVQEKALAAATADLEGTPAPVVSRALEGKWYERIGLRGYTQFRLQDVVSHRGAVLEVPADRTVAPDESFAIRRGRFIFSGDVAPRLSLYAQSDFSGSNGTGDFMLQARDLYGDVWLDGAKTWRVRVGQSKVPFGWVNLQSSQNRGPFERPDALNSAVEGERDLGAAVMWASTTTRRHFRDLVAQGLKGSGDYGVATMGLYSGQGLNRPDRNGTPHLVTRVSYPFKTAGGQYFELGVQGYRGRFVSPTQAITAAGETFTPEQATGGVLDQRLAVTAVVYPQPVGLEAEWTFGEGPELSPDLRTIDRAPLHGGYVQASYRNVGGGATWYPFVRWNYFDGARKFVRNAPRNQINEVDVGLEIARWAEVEVTGMFTHTFRRTRTGSFPFDQSRSANRVGLQVQWNY